MKHYVRFVFLFVQTVDFAFSVTTFVCLSVCKHFIRQRFYGAIYMYTLLRILKLGTKLGNDTHKLYCVLENQPHIMPFLLFSYAPNFEKVGDILVSACPYVCVCVCMYSCSRYRLETSCMDSSWKSSRRIFLVFPELSPLVK